MKLTLPYPPSINHYWRRSGRHIHTSREGREYRETIVSLLKAGGFRPLTCRLSVRILACPPDRRRRDLDNLQKPLLDALKHGGAYEDDSLIDRLLTVRGPSVPGGCVKVTITRLPDRPAPLKPPKKRKQCKASSYQRSLRSLCARTKRRRNRPSITTCGRGQTTR